MLLPPINNNLEKIEVEEISSDNEESPSDEEVDEKNNTNIFENEQYKIPNLFERLLQNKNNIKYKEIIREKIKKKL